jgi:membrane protease subunit HflK
MRDKITGAVLSEDGPWGGGSEGGEGGKKPWRAPAGGAGPSALDALIQRGRERLGGGNGGNGGGRGPERFQVGNAWRWGMLALVVLWIALTSAHTIGPQQRGVITRFGKYVGMLQPGLGLSFPAPIDIVSKIESDADGR